MAQQIDDASKVDLEWRAHMFLLLHWAGRFDHDMCPGPFMTSSQTWGGVGGLGELSTVGCRFVMRSQDRISYPLCRFAPNTTTCSGYFCVAARSSHPPPHRNGAKQKGIR